MREGLGTKFSGTSNCKIAMTRELEAIGTNAHELPMVYAALAKDDAALAQSPYDVLQDWQDEHDGNLRIILPDTYGTQGFLDNAPEWLNGWTGIRIDSGDPATAAQVAIDWWTSRGEDPREKRVSGGPAGRLALRWYCCERCRPIPAIASGLVRNRSFPGS